MRWVVCMLVVFVGCVTTIRYDDAGLTAQLATEAARMVVQSRATPAPPPKPDDGDKCTNCNGTGKVGDGTVSVVCPVCKGTGKKTK